MTPSNDAFPGPRDIWSLKQFKMTQKMSKIPKMGLKKHQIFDFFAFNENFAQISLAIAPKMAILLVQYMYFLPTNLWLSRNK